MQLYLILKSLHLVGVIMFIGNIAVTGWWKAMADRTRDPRIIAFAQRQVTLTDLAFTLGGVVLLGVSGATSAVLGGIDMATPWIKFGAMLFGAAGVVWLAILVPVQTRLGRLARGFAAGGAIPDAYWRLERVWVIFGLIATLLPLAAVPVMVFKAG